METYLITGISGFVAGHYLEYLSSRKPQAKIIGVDISCPKLNFLPYSFRKKITFYQKSLLSKRWVFRLLKKHKPNYIINLASHSSVAYSWQNPAECFINNTNLFLNIVEAARRTGINAKILSVGSSEVYGNIRKKDMPVKEEMPLNPNSPYAVARVAEERLSVVYATGYKVPIICTRSFNHIGPRQKDTFAISSFAKQVAMAKKGKQDKIRCGNLDIVRDFTDVRDIVRAYELLLKKGKSGEVYNICAGKGHKLSKVLKMLQKKANVCVPIKVDKNLLRVIDSPVMIGSSKKLRKDTGFQKKYSLSDSLADMLKYWQNRI